MPATEVIPMPPPGPDPEGRGDPLPSSMVETCENRLMLDVFHGIKALSSLRCRFFFRKNTTSATADKVARTATITAIITTTVVEMPPLSELCAGSVVVGVEVAVAVEDMAEVVVVSVPFGAGAIVMVPHRTGPHCILARSRNPAASPEYSM